LAVLIVNYIIFIDFKMAADFFRPEHICKMFECELYIEKRHPPPLLRNSMPKRIHLMGRVAHGVGVK
ncbi:MAG: hypothetical protein EBT51_12580, partial [Flavobacteriaceae bacterium]|nr:hypothetical protein [Flavobacteriaceae bacterium]